MEKKVTEESMVGSPNKPVCGQFLGVIETEIVGMQYYEATVRPGEKIHLEREPENPYDRHAIRVENASFQPVGHLPRKVAAWLAPLLDAGEIWVEGETKRGVAPKYGALPVLLSVYLCRKGMHILCSNADPRNDQEMYHQIALQVWQSATAWTRPWLIRQAQARLEHLGGDSLLPKTRLLLALLSGLARTATERKKGSILSRLREIVQSLRILPPRSYEEVKVFPLAVAEDQPLDYYLLQDVANSWEITVSETGRDGHVSKLWIHNRSNRPLLLLEGELLTGLKQDRVVNLSLLVEPGNGGEIPVSCVEQGRWSGKMDDWNVAPFAPIFLRSMKLQSVLENLRTHRNPQSNQEQLWRRIEEDVRRFTPNTSPTNALLSLYPLISGELTKYRKALSLPEETTGIVFVLGDEILAVDLFDSREAFAKLWPRLAEGYFMELLLPRYDSPYRPEEVTKETIQDLFKSVAAQVDLEVSPVGSGYILTTTPDSKYFGSGIWHHQRLYHFSLFS